MKILDDLLKANRAANKKNIADFNKQTKRLVKLLEKVNKDEFK